MLSIILLCIIAITNLLAHILSNKRSTAYRDNNYRESDTYDEWHLCVAYIGLMAITAATILTIGLITKSDGED